MNNFSTKRYFGSSLISRKTNSLLKSSGIDTSQFDPLMSVFISFNFFRKISTFLPLSL